MTPFFFAWVDAGTSFDPVAHAREDEEIVRAKIEQLETEFATLTIDIRNPRMGLLNAGRKLWAWFSWDSGSGVVPLFFGRVVGIPSNLHREIVTLQFLARPEDYGAQKSAVADTLRVLPYYDPVFIRPEMVNDPDVVLEGRTQVWDIDRVTHAVSITDLLVGEDGTLEFLESEVPYESVEITLSQPPVRAVAVKAEVSWTQHVEGRGLPFLTDYYVPTLAAAGLIDGWPKPSVVVGGPMVGAGNSSIVKGDELGGGWYAFTSDARSPYANLKDDDWANWYLFGQIEGDEHAGRGAPPFYLSCISSYSASVSNSGASFNSTKFAIINDIACCNLTLGYEAERKRKDVIQFVLVADSQPIVTMPDDDEVLDLSVAGNDVGMVVLDPDAPPSPRPDPPIGSPLRRAYFAGDRGMQSIQYIVQLARARIIARSRAVTVKWKCKFDRAVAFSLRKNALLHDRRIPGGQAVGKIIGYSLNIDGGEISGEVSMASCIGYGGSIAPVPGDPAYVDDGYVDDGYQFRDGAIVVLAASDVGFEPLGEAPNDDGLVFPLGAVPLLEGPTPVTTQKVPLRDVQPTSTQGSTQVDDCGNTTSVSVSSALDTGPYTDWLGGIETTVNFKLAAVEGGPFESVYVVNVTDLKLPMQIDLEAPPSP